MENGAIIKCSRCNLDTINDKEKGIIDEEGNYICSLCLNQERMNNTIKEIYKILSEIDNVLQYLQYEANPIAVEYLLKRFNLLINLTPLIEEITWAIYDDETGRGEE